MPGFWELPKSVLCAILHTDATTVGWAFGLRNLQVPGQVIGLAGMPFDMARNTACMRALDMGVDNLLFLDSDVIPPPDAVHRLLRHNLPIVSGVYCRRSPPHSVPVMLKGGQWVYDLPDDKKIPGYPLLEVDLVGAGCLLISTDVLRSLPPQRSGCHWFDWRVHLRGTEGHPPETCLSEDFTFNVHAKKHGVPTLVDVSIRCKHVGNAEFGYKSVAPLDTGFCF